MNRRQPILPNPLESLVEDGTMTVKQLMAFTGLSETKILRKIKAREIDFIRVDGRYLIPKKSAIRFLADRVALD